MDFASRYQSCNSAVQRRVDPVQLLLSRRVVADDRMDVAVDQSGGERNAIRVDDGVGIINV